MNNFILLLIGIFVILACGNSSRGGANYPSHVMEKRDTPEKNQSLVDWLSACKDSSYFELELNERVKGTRKTVLLFINKGWLFIAKKYDIVQNNYPLLDISSIEQKEDIVMPKTFPPPINHVTVDIKLIDKLTREYIVTHSLSKHESLDRGKRDTLDQRIFHIFLKKGIIEYESIEGKLKDDWPY